MNLRRFFCFPLLLIVMFPVLPAGGAVLLETRFGAEGFERNFGHLFLEVDAEEVRYSFWGMPEFEPPGGLRIRSGAGVERTLRFGEGALRRFHYGSAGFWGPENPFLKAASVDGEMEWIPAEGDIPGIHDRLKQPALTQWVEYSGSLRDSELAGFLAGEEGLVATLGALRIRRVEGVIVFSNFVSATGELVYPEGIGMAVVPEPAAVGFVFGVVVLVFAGWRRRQGAEGRGQKAEGRGQKGTWKVAWRVGGETGF